MLCLAFGTPCNLLRLRHCGGWAAEASQSERDGRVRSLNQFKKFYFYFTAAFWLIGGAVDSSLGDPRLSPVYGLVTTTKWVMTALGALWVGAKLLNLYLVHAEQEAIRRENERLKQQQARERLEKRPEPLIKITDLPCPVTSPTPRLNSKPKVSKPKDAADAASRALNELL